MSIYREGWSQQYICFQDKEKDEKKEKEKEIKKEEKEKKKEEKEHKKLKWKKKKLGSSKADVSSGAGKNSSKPNVRTWRMIIAIFIEILCA